MAVVVVVGRGVGVGEHAEMARLWCDGMLVKVRTCDAFRGVEKHTPLRFLL